MIPLFCKNVYEGRLRPFPITLVFKIKMECSFFFLLLKISVYKGVSLSRFAPVSIEFCEGQKRVLEHMDLELHELMGTV